MDEPRGLIGRIGSRSPRLRAALGALALLGACSIAVPCVFAVLTWAFATDASSEATLGGCARMTAVFAGMFATLAAVVYLLAVTWMRLPSATRGLAVTRRTLAEGAAGLPSGALLVGAVFVLAVACHGDRAALAPATQRPGVALMLVVAAELVFGAAWEEVVFRGGLVGVLSAGFSRPIAVLVPAALFGLAHATNPGASVVSVVNTALAGAFFGWIYLGALAPSRGPSLGFCTGLHAGWNYMLGTVLGIPVSGHAVGPRWLDVASLRPLWSGGAYGLEAGLATTLVLAPLTAWAAWRVLRVKTIA